jgi:hypothetical protein
MQTIVINSRNRQPDNATSYGDIIVNFGGETIKATQKVRLKNFTFPNTLYNVFEGTNSFTLNGSVVSLPPGTYSAQALISMLNTLGSTLSPSVTFAYNFLTFCLNATCSGPISLIIPDMTIARTLGLTAPGTYSAVSGVPFAINPPDLLTASSIYIVIDQMPQPVVWVSNPSYPVVVSRATFALPIDVTSTVFGRYSWYEQKLEVVTGAFTCNQLRIRLLNDAGMIIPNVTSHWTLTLDLI